MTEPFYEQLFGVRGKVALVTGGTRGIGLLIAEGLVRAGARVYVSSRKEDACRETQEQLSKWGECIALPCDLSELENVKRLSKTLAERESELHILVNNAGVTWSLDIDDFTEKAWDKVMNLDVKSPFFLIQSLLPLLRQAASPESKSSIVNITSVDGVRASTLRNYSYGAAKAGLGHLTRQLALDLVEDHINVNAIAPGLFKSKMTAPLFSTEEMTNEATNSVPMKRWGRLEDAAGLTIFLSSRAGSFLTGVTIPCDGGATTIG